MRRTGHRRIRRLERSLRRPNLPKYPLAPLWNACIPVFVPVAELREADCPS